MPGLPLTSLERKRIDDILAAVSAKDWSRFEALSDDAFINPVSMREQFDHTIDRVSDDFGAWEDTAHVEKISDGTRLIHVVLPNKAATRPEIDLIIHSSTTGVSVWVFYERFEWEP